MSRPLPMPFVSAWDPSGGASGSIDPLGALRGFNAMATTILPGVTTITTRPRYLSWLCAGLYLLDGLPDAPRGGRAGRERRKRLLAWERIVALATGTYANSADLTNDDEVWRKLRGISYVRDAVADRVRTSAFPLLRNQAGVGGVGTYWVTLVSGGLVESEPGSLTQRGEELARAFLKRPGTPDLTRLRRVLSGKHAEFSLRVLGDWGRVAHLGAASASERRRLADALLEPPAHRFMASAIHQAGIAESNRECFLALRDALATRQHPVATKLSAVLDVAVSFEQLHGELLNRFDLIRAANLHGNSVRLSRVADAVGAAGKLPSMGAELRERLDKNAADLPYGVTNAVRSFLLALEPTLQAPSPLDRTTRLLRHHERVQAGKTDASRQPKQPWMELRQKDVVVAPRYALRERPARRPFGAFTHPYRVEQFAGMLRETGARGTAA